MRTLRSCRHVPVTGRCRYGVTNTVEQIASCSARCRPPGNALAICRPTRCFSIMSRCAIQGTGTAVEDICGTGAAAAERRQRLIARDRRTRPPSPSMIVGRMRIRGITPDTHQKMIRQPARDWRLRASRRCFLSSSMAASCPTEYAMARVSVASRPSWTSALAMACCVLLWMNIEAHR